MYTVINFDGRIIGTVPSGFLAWPFIAGLVADWNNCGVDNVAWIETEDGDTQCTVDGWPVATVT